MYRRQIYFGKTSYAIFGFTLLEVLLAFTILAIVLTMVYSILISTLNTRKWIQETAEVERVGNRLVSLLVRDIQSIYFYQVNGSCLVGEKGASGSRIDFITNADSLASVHDVQSDLCEVGYHLEANHEEQGVYWLIRREDFFIDKNLLKGGSSIRLYDRVVNFEIQFYNLQGSKSDSWDSSKQKGLPIAVEITLGLPEVSQTARRGLLNKNISYFKMYIPILVSPKLPEPEKEKGKKE